MYESKTGDANLSVYELYQYYTDEVWGDKRNKALMINTSATGVDGAVELIADYLKMKGYVE